MFTWPLTNQGDPRNDMRGQPSALAKAADTQACVSQMMMGSTEAIARAFGAKLQREHPRDWPRLLGLAAQAAMEAEHGEGG